MSWKTPYPGLACTIAFWLVLVLLGWPMPSGDDIFFLGAAFNLASGGTFTNPHTPEIVSLGATDNFFVYTPLQPCVLALWLKVFGIGRASLVAFHTLTCAVAGGALFDIIRPCTKRPFLYVFSLNLAVAILLSLRGFRPDALGLALFAVGLRLVLAESPAAWFGYSLVLFLSVLASPLFGAMTLVVIFYAAFLRHGALEHGFPPVLRKLALVALAGALSALLFLWLIDFRVATFLSVFDKARKVAGTFTLMSALMAPRGLLRLTMQLFLPLASLVAILVFAKWGGRFFAPPLKRGELLALVLASAGIVFNLSSSASGEILFGFSFVVFCFFIATRLDARYQGIAAALCVAFLALFYLSFGRYLTQNLQSVVSRTPNVNREIQARLDALKPTHIYIDSAAANRFYNYHLPPNSYDLVFGVGTAWTSPLHSRGDFPPGSVLVVSTESALHCIFAREAVEQNHIAHRPMRLLGKLYPETEADPYELVLIDPGIIPHTP